MSDSPLASYTKISPSRNSPRKQPIRKITLHHMAGNMSLEAFGTLVAKPWVDHAGQSGMYMTGECYRAESGTVYRCKQDNCVWDANGLPSAWEEVQI